MSLVFTHTEKESDSGVTGTVRTLTVKRSQTLAKSLRSPLGDSGGSKSEKVSDGRLAGNEVFAGFLDEIIPLIACEQNFLSEFFHMQSFGACPTYIDFVQSSGPEERRTGDLNRRRVPESDKQVAKMLFDTMTEIFGFLQNEMQSFVGAITTNDPL